MKILFLFAGLIILIFSTNDWRISLKSIFFIVVLEGVIRKWVFPDASELVYFLKDIVLVGAYINYFFLSDAKKRPIKSYFFTLFLSLSFSWGLFQVFNPSLGSWLIGILGLKAYFLYVPMVWMIPDLFQSEGELYNFVRSHLLLTIPVGILGVVQFLSPKNSFINSYSNDAITNVAGFAGEDIARISGTFSYLGSYSVYLTVCFALLFCLFNLETSKKWKIIISFQIALVMINSFMTGSRTAVFASLIFVLGFILLELFKSFQSTMSLVQKIILPIVIAVLMLNIGLGKSYEVFSERATIGSEEFDSRTFLFITDPINNFKHIGFDSYGIGATHQARSAVSYLLNLPRGKYIPIEFEQESGRIMLDLGLVGFIFWYGLRLTILASLFSLYIKLSTPLLRQFALSAFLVHLIQIRGHVVYNHTFAVYYWFLASFVFLLPLLDLKNKINTYKKHQHLNEIALN